MKLMKNKHFTVLFFITLLGAFLRFFKITEIPICMNWDEASFAYNAFSILETGKDEYGVSLPIQFKSVGDYKLPFFIYALVPIIKVFGLQVFSIRLLPSLLGTLSIPLIYFLSIKLFKSPAAGLFSSFFLAISPWHIQFTRAGADVGVSSFFTLLAISSLIYALKKDSKYFFLSLLSFTIAFYTYFGERIFIPVFILFTIIHFRKEISKKINTFKKAVILSLVFLVPAIYSVFSSGQQEKFIKTTIFGSSRLEEYSSTLQNEDMSEQTLRFFHSEILENSLAVMNHYLNHFSPSFLFINGPSYDPRQFIYQMGMMYLFDLPFLTVGLILILKKKSKWVLFALIWLLIAPIPAAITRDPVHARRALNMIFPLMIILGVGVDKLYRNINKIKYTALRAGVQFGIVTTFLYFFSFYLLSYYIFTPLKTYKGPSGWNCGYKELINTITKYKSSYENIVVDTSYQGPYIFFLFYEKYPPDQYQPQAKLIQTSPDALGEGGGYDSYTFRPVYWPDDRRLEKTLFVAPPERIPEKDIDNKQAKILEKVPFFNGEIAFVLVETF